jgi:dihydrofolate synthase/folylpolyglutamate synthase
VAAVVRSLRDEGIYPTEFEIITAIGFVYFSEQRVDAAVIEVGMGGRLDSTNIIQPLATAITSIDLDHTKVLGGTVELIAYEKAGIAKPGAPMILYPGASEAVARVVRDRCAEVGAPFIPLGMDRDDGSIADIIHVGLLGEHQWSNAATARAVCEAIDGRGLDVPGAAVDEGLIRADWPGRLEWVRSRRHDFPRVVLLDGAHNPQGGRALAAYLNAIHRPVTLITGMLREKDAAGFTREIAPAVSRVLCVTPDSHRALRAEELARVYRDVCAKEALVCPTLAAALHIAKASGEPPLGWCVIAGSLYLVGEARTLLDAPPCTLLTSAASNSQ